jgi:hypothetical protein
MIVVTDGYTRKSDAGLVETAEGGFRLRDNRAPDV